MALARPCHLTQAKTIKTDYSRKLVRREASFKHTRLPFGEVFSSLVNKQERVVPKRHPVEKFEVYWLCIIST